MSNDVFISYSSKDASVAEAACAAIEAVGLQCWIAPRDIFAGEDWPGAIIRGINSSRVMVLIFSASANTSHQIKREVERAVNRGMPVIPFRIEDLPPSANLEFFISTPHWLDAYKPPMERHFKALAQAVQRLLEHRPDEKLQSVGAGPSGIRKNEKISSRRRQSETRGRGGLVAIALILIAGIGAAGWYWFRGQFRAIAFISPSTQATASRSPSQAPATTVPAAPVALAESPIPVATGPAVTSAPLVVNPLPTVPVAPAESPTTSKGSAFSAGDYVCIAGGSGSLKVEGPFPADDGRTTWLYTGIVNGTWTTGPARGHPQLLGFPKDAMFPADCSFGMSTGGDLIDVQQVGETLIIIQPRQTKDEYQRIEFFNEGSTQWMFQKKPPIPQ